MVTFDDAPEIAARIVRAKREAEQECRRVDEVIAHMLAAAILLDRANLVRHVEEAITLLRRAPLPSRAVPPDDDREDVE